MPTTDSEITARQSALQSEADEVAADLGLTAELAAFGTAVRTGSSALGLMVKPDVDVTVACPKLDEATWEAVVGLGNRLTRHPRVWQVMFRDDTGEWNQEPDAYPDGLYLGVRYRTAAGRDWNLDLWFVDEPERMPDLAHLETLLPRITEEARVPILRIKQAWAARPEYGRTVRGIDVYTAVLDDGVRTVEEFEAWVAARG